jgi:hypothetical protein
MAPEFPWNIDHPVQHAWILRGPANAVSECARTINTVLIAVLEDSDLGDWAKHKGVEITTAFNRTDIQHVCPLCASTVEVKSS